MKETHISSLALWCIVLKVLCYLTGCVPYTDPPWPETSLVHTTTTREECTTTTLEELTTTTWATWEESWPPYETPTPAPVPRIPKYRKFPWPPPRASAIIEIPPEFFERPNVSVVYLNDIINKLKQALDVGGYSEKSFYIAPEGFAVVTRLEQFSLDGVPKESPERWSLDLGPLRTFSVKKYIKALFKARIGYYRIIVFVVSPRPFSQADSEVSFSEAVSWLTDGLNKVPWSIGLREFTEEYSCTALIYEFIRPESEKKAYLKFPGYLTARRHLKKSGIWNVLKE